MRKGSWVLKWFALLIFEFIASGNFVVSQTPDWKKYHLKSCGSELGHDGAVEEIFLKAPHRNPLVQIYEAQREPKTEKNHVQSRIYVQDYSKMAAWLE